MIDANVDLHFAVAEAGLRGYRKMQHRYSAEHAQTRAHGWIREKSQDAFDREGEWLGARIGRRVRVEVAPSFEDLESRVLSGSVDIVWAPPHLCARVLPQALRDRRARARREARAVRAAPARLSRANARCFPVR